MFKGHPKLFDSKAKLALQRAKSDPRIETIPKVLSDFVMSLPTGISDGVWKTTTKYVASSYQKDT